MRTCTLRLSCQQRKLTRLLIAMGMPGLVVLCLLARWLPASWLVKVNVEG